MECTSRKRIPCALGEPEVGCAGDGLPASVRGNGWGTTPREDDCDANDDDTDAKEDTRPCEDTAYVGGTDAAGDGVGCG